MLVSQESVDGVEDQTFECSLAAAAMPWTKEAFAQRVPSRMRRVASALMRPPARSRLPHPACKLSACECRQSQCGRSR